MPTSFVSYALIFRNLFDRRLRYTIPLYQRPYSWSIRESTRLLDDLISAMGEDPEQFVIDTYFLGAIILTGARNQIGQPPTPGGKIREMFHSIIAGDKNFPKHVRGELAVVDGKQRLITLQILLCLLRDLSTGDETDGIGDLIGAGADGQSAQITMRGDESKFFHEFVLKPGSTLSDVNIEGLPQSQQNIKLVRDALHEILIELSDSERKRLFDYIVNHCEIVVILTEEFSNAYQIFVSINDTGSPLVQGDILKAELMSQININLQGQYRSILEQWNDSLGEPETKRGTKKTFFNHFWYALTASPTTMLADLRKKVDELGGAVPFIDNLLLPHAKAYEIIKSCRWPHARRRREIEHVLGLLDWLPHDEWVSSALLAITRYENEPDTLVAFLRKLERLAYTLLIQPMGALNRRKRYNPIRRALRDPAGPLDPMTEAELTPAERRIVRRTISHGLHRSHSPAARLVLLRLDLHTGHHDIAYYNALLAEEGFSVEHMLPRSPRKGTRWYTLFPDDVAREHDTELLGNLFLVREKSENPPMKNYDFATKREILFASREAHPCVLTDGLKMLDDWRQQDIDQRQQVMMDMVDEMWDLGIEGEEQQRIRASA